MRMGQGGGGFGKEKDKEIFPVGKNGRMRNGLLEAFREFGQQRLRWTLFDKEIESTCLGVSVSLLNIL